jgi:hypothetical protein
LCGTKKQQKRWENNESQNFHSPKRIKIKISKWEERNLCLSMNCTESLQQQLTIQVNKVCVMSFLGSERNFAWLALRLLALRLQHTRTLPESLLRISS